MRIRLGLTHPSPAWEQLAQQEGVAYGFPDMTSGVVTGEYSLLVVSGGLAVTEQEAVRAYLRDGGAMIGYVGHLAGLRGCESHPHRIDYIIADHDAVFPDIHVLDLGMDGAILREANHLRLDSNSFALYAGGLEGGHAVLLPFDVSKALSDPRATLKHFYSPQERLPTERVSYVGKNEIRHLVHRSFEWLHQVRGVPYTHLWYFPDGKENLFAFRIDTDGSPQADVDELYDIADRHHLGLSWYLDVKSHEHWLHRFAAMRGQEIGLHCYEHATFDGTEANISNIARASALMKAAGLAPEGFTAPFGTWHPALAEAIDQSGFAYSSEFSCAYDTFPLYPVFKGREYKTLQVPIHPICIGSLSRIGYSETHMTAYFRGVIRNKLDRCEPLFFYHHPTHRGWGVVEDLFRSIVDAGIPGITLGDFARWWKHRLSVDADVQVDGNELSVTTNDHGGAGQPWLRIVRPDGHAAVTPIEPSILLERLEWRSQRMIMPPGDIRKTREFDPRSALGALYTRLMRKFT